MSVSLKKDRLLNTNHVDGLKRFRLMAQGSVPMVQG